MMILNNDGRGLRGSTHTPVPCSRESAAFQAKAATFEGEHLTNPARLEKQECDLQACECGRTKQVSQEWSLRIYEYELRVRAPVSAS